MKGTQAVERSQASRGMSAIAELLVCLSKELM